MSYEIDFKELKEVEEKLETIKILKQDLKEYYETIEDSSCDKYQIGIKGDWFDFSAIKINISIGGYYGFYGDPSCYSALHIKNEDFFRKTFISVLHNHFEELMNETIEEMSKELSQQKESIKQRAQEFIETIDELQ